MCGQSWAATSSHKLQSLRVYLLLHELSSSCSSSGKHLLAPAERFSMDCSAGTCSVVILVILSSGCRGISAPWAHPPFPLFPMFSHFFPHTPQHYFHVLPFFTCVFQGAPACGGSSVDAAGSGWKQLCLAGTGWNQLDLAVPGWNWLEPAGTGWNWLELAGTSWGSPSLPPWSSTATTADAVALAPPTKVMV